MFLSFPWHGGDQRVSKNQSSLPRKSVMIPICFSGGTVSPISKSAARRNTRRLRVWEPVIQQSAASAATDRSATGPRSQRAQVTKDQSIRGSFADLAAATGDRSRSGKSSRLVTISTDTDRLGGLRYLIADLRITPFRARLDAFRGNPGRS